MPHDDLPPDVVRCLDALVDSLESLEIMLLLFRRRGRGFTIEQVADELGVSAPAARRGLERMQARGLAAVDGAPDAYRYAPQEGAPVADLECIVQAYGTRRIAITNYVASRALERIQSLAEAFRLNKKD